MDSVGELVQTTMVYVGIVLDYVYLLSTCTTLKYMQMNVLVTLTLKPCLWMCTTSQTLGVFFYQLELN